MLSSLGYMAQNLPSFLGLCLVSALGLLGQPIHSGVVLAICILAQDVNSGRKGPIFSDPTPEMRLTSAGFFLIGERFWVAFGKFFLGGG
jgi:hypothetical protein